MDNLLKIDAINVNVSADIVVPHISIETQKENYLIDEVIVQMDFEIEAVDIIW